MQARMFRLTLALVAVMAAGSAWIWWSHGEQIPSAQSNAIPASTVSRADSSAGIRPAASGGPAPALQASNTRPSSRLAREFANARDWRAFALNAKTRPEEGGYFYAQQVALQCATRPPADVSNPELGAAAEVARTGTVSTAVIERMARWTALCAGFTEGEPRALFREMLAAAKDGRDPLLNARQKVLSALSGGGNGEQVKPALSALLALDDSLAIDAGGMLMRVMQQPSGEAFSFWFDGHMYESKDGFDSEVGLASSVAECSGQTFCGVDSELNGACLVGRVCLESRTDFWRDLYVNEYGHTEAQFQKALLLGERMRSAIKAQRVDAFVR